MNDYWENAPEWATMVVYDAEENDTFYLEHAGEPSRVMTTSGVDMGLGIWTKTLGSLVVEYRPDEYYCTGEEELPPREEPQETEARVLTDEEYNLLDDLGLLDYALEIGVVEPPVEDEDTRMSVTVTNLPNGDILFHNTDTEDHGFYVGHFAETMMEAYKALGFMNDMEIKFDGGYTGMTYKVSPTKDDAV